MSLAAWFRARIGSRSRKPSNPAKRRHFVEPLESRVLLAIVSWDGGAGTFNWHDSLNWDSDIVPTLADDAVIGDLTGTPTISVSSSASLNSLTSAESLSFNGGTFTVATTANVSGANISLNGGTLSGGTWNLTGGALQVQANGANLLSGVAINGELDLAAASARTRVQGGTTFTLARLRGFQSSLMFAPGETITGTVRFEGGSTGGTRALSMNGSSGTLTVGPTGVIETVAGLGDNVQVGPAFHLGGSMTLINNGTIRSQASGRTLLIDPAAFTNHGTAESTAGTLNIDATSWSNSPGATLRATGATLTLGGDWDNNGTLAIDNGTLNLGGTFSTQDIGTFSRVNGGAVNITGAWNNSDGPWTLDDATGTWRLAGGSISGGTLNVTQSAVLSVLDSATNLLSGVAINGELDLAAASARTRVQGGTTFTLARLRGFQSSLMFAPGETITGTVRFEGGSTGGTRALSMNGSSGTLTVGPTGVIETVAGLGDNVQVGPAFHLGGSMTLINNGTIRSQASGRTLLIDPAAFTNHGTAESTAGTLNIDATSWSNSPGATLRATGATLTLGGDWDNNGTLAIDNGTLNLGGTFSTQDIGTFSRVNGGAVNITGAWNNSDGPWTLDDATGTWRLAGGSISGGTLNVTQSAVLSVLDSATNLLSGVAINGELDLAAASARTRVQGGTTFTLARLRGFQSSLMFAPGETITGTVRFEGGSTGGTRALSMNGSSGTLTVGPTGVIETVAGLGDNVQVGPAFHLGGSMTLINNGTIRSQASGRTLLIDPAAFTNHGTAESTAGTLNIDATSWSNSPGATLRATGATLTLGGDWDNNGTLAIDNGTLNLGGTFSTQDIGTFSRVNGGAVNITGAWNNSDGPWTLDDATGTWRLAGGSISGGTLNVTQSAVLSVLDSATNLLSGVAINGELDLAAANARTRVQGGTTFTLARLRGFQSSLMFAPGETITGTVRFEGGSTGGTRALSMNGSSGTLTVGPTGVIETVAGLGDNVQVGPAFHLGGSMTLINNGTIRSQASGRTLLIDPAAFTNGGVLQASAGGLLQLVPTPTNLSGGTLTGGTWQVIGNSALRLPTTSVISTNAATILLDGLNSRFERGVGVDALSTLSVNAAGGSFTLRNGRNFTTAGAFANGGLLAIGLGSTFSVAGNLDVQSGATVDFELNSPAAIAGLHYGQLNVSGTIGLTGGLLAVSGGFVSSTGDMFTIVSATSVTGIFNSLPENTRLPFNGRNLRVNYTATTVKLTDVGRPPAIDPQSFNLDENLIAVGTVVATDPDLPNDTLTLALTGNGPDDSLFSVLPSGALSFNAPPNYESPLDVGGTTGDNTYLVQVRVTDAFDNTAMATMAIHVLPVNDNAPVFTSAAAFNVAENTTAVGTATATDADLPGQSITISISGGADAAKFSITSGGVLSFNAATDFETPADAGANNVYDVQVTANDGNGLTTVQAIAVTVTPVNDNAPVFTSAAAASVPENTTAVQSLSATDADLPAQTVVFALVGGADQAKFILVSGNQLQFLAAPDFENPADVGGNNVYEVQVRADDQQGLTTVQLVSVTVTNANDAPSAGADSVVTDEDTPVVISVLANDADVDGNPLTISSATDPPGGSVAINPGGTITYTPDANFHGTDTFSYTISDGQGGSATAVVTITVNSRPDVDLRGRVFDDRDNDGAFNGSDAGIAGVSVQLFSESNLVTPLATVATAADGTYLFDLDLGAGAYRIVAAQPAGLLDGKETAGALGGVVSNTADSNTVQNIVVTSSAGDLLADGYNFAEIRASRLQGLVWEDANNNGNVDFGEQAISGVIIRLTGTDDRGAAVDRIMQTDSQGIFEFLDLRPSDSGGYAVSETQPLGFLDGLDSLGTVNGTISGTSAVNDVFSQIGMTQPGSDGINYNFGEIPATTSGVQAGQTATIGFWQNNNGQALIKSLNGGPNATQLANWLATSFPNMYGAAAGPNNLTGMTNAQVAEFYKTLFKRNAKTAAGSGPPKVDAQVLAVALAAYVTSTNLAGTAGESYGFTVDSFGLGAATFNVGTGGAAFGVANNSAVRLLDLLLAVNARTSNGLLFDLNGDGDTNDPFEGAYRTMANDVFSAINEAGDIG